MARFNYQRVSNEVHEYCVHELEHMAYTTDCTIDSIDDVDPDVWDSIVEKHDTGKVSSFA